MWTPDVYEGAPTPVTAFFSAAPKLAAVALLTRVVVGPFGHLMADWRQVIVFISIASMLLGAVAGINQRNIKRLMAYSSIGHIGYGLVGLAAGTPEGVRGLLIYMSLYVMHDARQFRVHPLHAPARRDGGADLRSRRRFAQQSDDGRGLGDLHVLHGGHPAAGRLLRQALCLPAGHLRRALYPGGDRRGRAASWAPITTCASSRSCISTS